MALDFAQVDTDGKVTNVTVRIDRTIHRALLEELDEKGFPLLSRMRDYYEDVLYEPDQLLALQLELEELARVRRDSAHEAVVGAMLSLVKDSISTGNLVEAIAD